MSDWSEFNEEAECPHCGYEIWDELPLLGREVVECETCEKSVEVEAFQTTIYRIRAVES